MVANTRKVFHPAPANEHDRMLLQVVPDPGNVGGDFDPVRESDPGHLPKRRIRLLRIDREDPDAHAPPLGAPLERRRIGGRSSPFPASADELVDRRHREDSSGSVVRSGAGWGGGSKKSGKVGVGEAKSGRKRVKTRESPCGKPEGRTPATHPRGARRRRSVDRAPRSSSRGTPGRSGRRELSAAAVAGRSGARSERMILRLRRPRCQMPIGTRLPRGSAPRGGPAGGGPRPQAPLPPPDGVTGPRPDRTVPGPPRVGEPGSRPDGR